MGGRMARTSKTLLFVVAALVGASSAMSQGSPPGDRVADREQIAAIVQKWEQAWNSHDMHAFASLFQEDGTWILWTGQVWSGRRAIEEGHAAVHKSLPE
jgi:hypothetical protein